MGTILHEIVAHTASGLPARKREEPLALLEGLRWYGDPRRDFAGALLGEDLAVIAEAKMASPSAGVIRDPFVVQDIAASYARAGAAAMSVLTEPDYFRGSLDYLGIAREAFPGPLLRKDFIVDPYQVIQARAYGADAILLIASVLERSQLAELLAAAHELGLEALIELHALAELDRIDLDQARVIGVNNRDLHTFEVNLEHAPAVLEHVPASIVRVAESGLRTSEDLAFVRDRGIDAVLIGEAFMRKKDPGEALLALTRPLTLPD